MESNKIKHIAAACAYHVISASFKLKEMNDKETERRAKLSERYAKIQEAAKLAETTETSEVDNIENESNEVVKELNEDKK